MTRPDETLQEQVARLVQAEVDEQRLIGVGRAALSAWMERELRIAERRGARAVLQKVAVEIGERMLLQGYEPRISDETPIGFTTGDDDD